MSAYKQPTFEKSNFVGIATTEGETIETKVFRIVNNKETIKDALPMIYTDRKDGVLAATDIRTDKWEVAIEATTKIEKSYAARRNGAGQIGGAKGDGGAKPIHDTKDQSDNTQGVTA